MRVCRLADTYLVGMDTLEGDTDNGKGEPLLDEWPALGDGRGGDGISASTSTSRSCGVGYSSI